MKKKLVIFGVGDFARIAHFYFQHDSDFEVAAYCVDEEFRKQDELMGLPVVPFESLTETHPPSDFGIFVGIAYSRVNRARTEVFGKVKSLGYETPRYVCSKATTWPDLDVGEGSFIFENNVIQPFVKIGSNTVLWSGNHIGHDSILGDNIFIASHVVISGNCRVGDNTFIGVNATVRDGITIGKNCVIGAGTVILKDAPDGAVYRATATEALPIESSALRKI
jgi:sugar O-acyltransferase (sialic acid O-acetyltransferase NeuD family)